MADERPGAPGNLSEAELARLKALADKRNQALDTASELIRKQDESRNRIVDKMR